MPLNKETETENHHRQHQHQHQNNNNNNNDNYNNYQNDSIKIGQNTEKIPGDLRRLAVTQSSVEDDQLTLV